MQSHLLQPRTTAWPCMSRAQPPHQQWQWWTPPPARRALLPLQAVQGNSSDDADAKPSQAKVGGRVSAIG
jgi:hypothetical protein